MALALILQMQMEPDGLRVRYDVGKNRYVRWQMGKGQRRTRSGLQTVGSVASRSNVLGPLSPARMGRGELLIPREALNQGNLNLGDLNRGRDDTVIQLMSYRTADGVGPAVSPVLSLPAPARAALPAPESRLALPPPAGFAAGQFLSAIRPNSPNSRSGEHSMSMVAVSERMQHGVDEQIHRGVRAIPFALKERSYSQPLFLEAIAGALPTLLPMLAPAIGTLLGSAAPAVGQVAGQILRQFLPGQSTPTQPSSQQPPAPQQPAAPARSQPQRPNAINPGAREAVGQIAQLAEQVLSALGPAAQQILTPENTRQVLQLIQAGQVASGQANAQSHAGGSVRAQNQSHQPYSQAQVAPALLAALPALMPLLRQVLSPQTVQSIIQAPERMTGQIINGISDFARLGLQADQQLNEHLLNFLPEEPTALYGLLSGMSLSLSGQYTRQYRRVNRVQLMVENLPTQMVYGREQVLLQRGQPWSFRLEVQTPKTISDAQLQVQIKSADTLKILYDERVPAGTISTGPLEVMPQIPAGVNETLKSGEDYILIFTLLWRNRRQQLRGAPVQQSLTVMDRYLFDRVQESSELIALSDRNTWADYWHQVWQMGFDSQTRRADLHSRYYLTLSHTERTHARVDSQVRKQNDGARATVRVRSGYEYSLTELNHLLRRLNGGLKPLSTEQLNALASPDFMNRFNQAAQHRGRLRGRPGDHAALWVFPSFKLQNIILVKAASVNQQGAVTQLTEEQVSFPMPAMVHFVGVKQT